MIKIVQYDQAQTEEKVGNLKDRNLAEKNKVKVIKSEVTCLLNNSKMIALATSDNRMDGRKANVFVADEVGALKNRYQLHRRSHSSRIWVQ